MSRIQAASLTLALYVALRAASRHGKRARQGRLKSQACGMLRTTAVYFYFCSLSTNSTRKRLLKFVPPNPPPVLFFARCPTRLQPLRSPNHVGGKKRCFQYYQLARARTLRSDEVAVSESVAHPVDRPIPTTRPPPQEEGGGSRTGSQPEISVRATMTMPRPSVRNQRPWRRQSTAAAPTRAGWERTVLAVHARRMHARARAQEERARVRPVQLRWRQARRYEEGNR